MHAVDLHAYYLTLCYSGCSLAIMLVGVGSGGRAAVCMWWERERSVSVFGGCGGGARTDGERNSYVVRPLYTIRLRTQTNARAWQTERRYVNSKLLAFVVVVVTIRSYSIQVQYSHTDRNSFELHRNGRWPAVAAGVPDLGAVPVTSVHGGRSLPVARVAHQRHALAVRPDRRDGRGLRHVRTAVLRRFPPSQDGRRPGAQTHRRRYRRRYAVPQRRWHVPGHGVLHVPQVAGRRSYDSDARHRCHGECSRRHYDGESCVSTTVHQNTTSDQKPTHPPTCPRIPFVLYYYFFTHNSKILLSKYMTLYVNMHNICWSQRRFLMVYGHG